MGQIGNIDIDFNIFSLTPSRLFVMDLSDWLYSENLPSYIEILIPGATKSKTFSFTKFKNNIFNSHNLGLSCLSADCGEEVYIDIPDGIYTITVKSSYENIETTKYYLKTDRFEVEYKKVLIKYGIDEIDQKFINLMTKIKYVLDVAKANTMQGDFVKANRYFQEAKKLLKRYVDCKNCI